MTSPNTQNVRDELKNLSDIYFSLPSSFRGQSMAGLSPGKRMGTFSAGSGRRGATIVSKEIIPTARMNFRIHEFPFCKKQWYKKEKETKTMTPIARERRIRHLKALLESLQEEVVYLSTIHDNLSSENMALQSIIPSSSSSRQRPRFLKSTKSIIYPSIQNVCQTACFLSHINQSLHEGDNSTSLFIHSFESGNIDYLLRGPGGSRSIQSLSSARNFETRQPEFEYFDYSERGSEIRFPVMKVNKINKNSLRILEIDIATGELGICKKEKNQLKQEYYARLSVITISSFIDLILSEDDKRLHFTYMLPNQKEKLFRAEFPYAQDRERFVRVLRLFILDRNRSINEAVPLTDPSLPTFIPPPLTITGSDEKAKCRHIWLQLSQESIASEIHKLWSLYKFKDGWRFGFRLDTIAKRHPSLRLFRRLPKPEVRHHKQLLVKTVEAVFALGFGFERKKQPQQLQMLVDWHEEVPFECMVLMEFFAENIHNCWCDSMISQKWVYGIEHCLTKNEKTHPLLVPWQALEIPVRQCALRCVYRIFELIINSGFVIVPLHEEHPDLAAMAMGLMDPVSSAVEAKQYIK